MREIQQTRALATRDKIIRAAAGLFALKGYHDTTLEEVRGVAEVTTGAFFHHFASKEDLGFAVLDRHMQKRREDLDQLQEEVPPLPDDEPLAPVFRRLDAIALMISRRAHLKSGCIIGNLSTSLSGTHEAFRQRLDHCFDEMAMEFQPHLDAAAKWNGSDHPVDTKSLARYIVAVIEGSIMLARTNLSPRELVSNFENLKNYLRQILPGASRSSVSR